MLIGRTRLLSLPVLLKLLPRLAIQRFRRYMKAIHALRLALSMISLVVLVLRLLHQRRHHNSPPRLHLPMLMM